MPQEMYFDNPDGAVFSIEQWKNAVDQIDNIRLEASLEDPEFTFEDAEIFEEETGEWHPALRWNYEKVSFNARIVSVLGEVDPIGKILIGLAAELGAKIRDEEGNICYPLGIAEPVPPDKNSRNENLALNPPDFEQKLEFWFQYDSINGVILAEEVATWLGEARVTKNVFVNNRKISPKRIPAFIDSSAYPDFRIISSDYQFNYYSAKKFRIDVFTISVVDVPSLSFWEDALNRFSKFGEFVSARLIDCGYDTWQNREDLWFYEQYNRPHEDLPKIKRDLPKPLDNWVIDISRNPGRKVRSEGSIEAIGGVMWLTENFITATGNRMDEIKAADFLDWEDSETFLRVTIDPELLKNGDSDKNLIEKQIRLRRLLFPKGSEFPKTG